MSHYFQTTVLNRFRTRPKKPIFSSFICSPNRWLKKWKELSDEAILAWAQLVSVKSLRNPSKMWKKMNKIAFLVGFYLLFVLVFWPWEFKIKNHKFTKKSWFFGAKFKLIIWLKKFVKCLEFLDIRIPEPQKNSLVIFVFFVSLLFFKSK